MSVLAIFDVCGRLTALDLASLGWAKLTTYFSLIIRPVCAVLAFVGGLQVPFMDCSGNAVAAASSSSRTGAKVKGRAIPPPLLQLLVYYQSCQASSTEG